MPNPKAYDHLVKVGYDPTKDVGMGKLPPEVTKNQMHGMNEVQKMLRRKGHSTKSSTTGPGYTPKQPLHILIKRVANYHIVEASQEDRRNRKAAKNNKESKEDRTSI
ncbi:hypothetical protein LIER_14163 [Lithospermum erythrorhizon]|uniref:Uncharacterized protein n=1 Tax=Lithospermum erythrorhizon TaxID=34254 RepID=A0AAV3Q0D3_LITER